MNPTARKSPRGHKKPQPRATPATTKPKKRPTAPPPPPEDWFQIRDIIRERVRRGLTEYLVDWEGIDPATDAPYEPTWVCIQACAGLVANLQSY
jgi:hypothetical protein